MLSLPSFLPFLRVHIYLLCCLSFKFPAPSTLADSRLSYSPQPLSQTGSKGWVLGRERVAGEAALLPWIDSSRVTQIMARTLHFGMCETQRASLGLSESLTLWCAHISSEMCPKHSFQLTCMNGFLFSHTKFKLPIINVAMFPEVIFNYSPPGGAPSLKVKIIQNGFRKLQVHSFAV